MNNCIIIVFDFPQYASRLEDLTSISISEIKEVCDFADRWEVFDKYLNEEYKDIELCRDDQGLVYDNFHQSDVYGLMLIK